MNEDWLRIRSYEGEGFQTLVEFNDWRVAILNYLDDIYPQCNNRMERHIETDEVFVLLKGRGILIIGGNGSKVEEILSQKMETGVLYNVRCGTWHTILLSRDASVLLVEQADTSEHNSEYAILSPELHRQILEIAEHEPEFM